MNIKDIIENSGLIESYVLEQLNEKEKAGVECLAKTYPEIQEEIENMRHALGKFYGAEVKTPPAFLKDKIFSQMIFAEEEIVEVDQGKEETKEPIPLQSKKVMPLWSKVSVAASVLFGLSTLYLWNSNRGLSTEQVALNSKLKAYETGIAENEQILNEFQNPDNKLIKLLGTEKQPTSLVAVLWNQKDNTVHLSVKNLPKTEVGKQYQLWYIGEKGPVDMGMLDNSFDGKLLTMKNVNGKPAAFAITLEKEGGVPSPTLENLYVIGNV